MAANWMHRALLVAACASATLLAACGSSTTESAITPARFIAFGDAYSDVGQKGTRYTVNDGSVNNWTLQLASRYGKTLTPAAAGGTSYAAGNARIAAKPDAAGDTATPTITEQVDHFLASDSFGANDVVLMNAGFSDLIVQAGDMTLMPIDTRKMGQDYGAQIRRLVEAGAKFVVVTGVYDLGKTPWAKSIDREAWLSNASSRFNEGLLVSIADLSGNVLYVDSAYYMNLYLSAPAAYGFNNTTAPICTSIDPGNGIGIGAGQVSSALCSASTLVASANPDRFVFADSVYATPSAHRQFGNYAYDRLRARW